MNTGIGQVDYKLFIESKVAGILKKREALSPFKVSPFTFCFYLLCQWDLLVLMSETQRLYFPQVQASFSATTKDEGIEFVVLHTKP